MKTPGPKSCKSKALSLDLTKQSIFMSPSYKKGVTDPFSARVFQQYRISNRTYH